MSHARQVIREKAALLLATTPTTWVSVLETRVPTKRQVYPYLMVYSDGEAVDNLTEDDPTVLQRDMNIVIVGMLRMPGGHETITIEDKLDAVAAEIETKLDFAALQAVVPKLHGLFLNSTEMSVVVTPDEQIDHAEIIQVWTARYYTLDGAPEVLI